MSRVAAIIALLVLGAASSSLPIRGLRHPALSPDGRRAGIDFRFEDHGNAHSVYLRDPDGHTIELTTYEL